MGPRPPLRNFALGGDDKRSRVPALPKAGVAPSFRRIRGAPFLRARRPKDAVVAQLVRAPVCGTGGRWFEPTQLYQINQTVSWVLVSFDPFGYRIWVSADIAPICAPREA